MKQSTSSKNVFIRQKPTIQFIGATLLFLLLFSACLEFDFVNQPLTGDPDSYFDVQISVSVQGDGSTTQALFGVLLPMGWSIEDTLLYQNTTTGDTCSLIYWEESVQWMNDIDPPPAGYFWWCGNGEDEQYDDNLNFYMELRIFTDSQTGSFLLDYMVGDKYVNGINYARSNNHVITIDAPESITVINTNDHGPGSFRDAIDNVDFYGSINFNIDPSDTLVLESELNIYKDLTITGPEEGNLVISGNNMVRVLFIPERNVLLSNLTLINGCAWDTGVVFAPGGGIYAPGSSVELSNIDIKNNYATSSGGGISGGIITFDSINKCSIYDNFAENRNDLSISCPDIVYLDTFSVLNPTSFHANSGLTFDIEYGLHEQSYETLYVSPFGSNSNNGLTADAPLKTINVAFSKSLASQQNKQIIFLDSGEYKFSNKGAYYPLRMLEYVSLQGLSLNDVILDAEDRTQVLRVIGNNDASLVELTIKGGHGSGNIYGGGIHCSYSNLTLQDVNIISNYGKCGGGISIRASHVNLSGLLVENNTSWDYGGGGIYCVDTTTISIKDSRIINNHSSSMGDGGGIKLRECISCILENVFISGNYAYEGGGIYLSNCNPVLKNVSIVNNSAHSGGGMYVTYSSPLIINSTITNNMVQNGQEGGGLYCMEDANPTIINSIVWDNNPTEIYCDYMGTPVPSFISISMSDIMGGEDGIITNGVGYVTWLEGNIDTDPLFTNIGEYPFSLVNESICINSGTPDTTGLNLPALDLAGNPRLYGGRIEMGAYENQEVVVSLEDFTKPISEPDLNIYPNPVRSVVIFEYALNEPGNVRLQITNQQGLIIETLVNGYKNQGEHIIRWDVGHLTAGSYNCWIRTGKNEKIRKFIKVE